MNEILRREIHPTIRVTDEKTGLVEYVASDETLDSYREIIKADGWRFNLFEKNSPFLDSHQRGSIEAVIGRVVDFRVQGRQLVETVKWAIDVADCKLAQLGFNMTKAGYLKAVSVGFRPTDMVTAYDRDPRAFFEACTALKVSPDECRAIYLEQEQVELSACVIGANPAALAKAYKAGVATDADVEMISNEQSKALTTNTAGDPAVAALVRQRERDDWLVRFETATKRI